LCSTKARRSRRSRRARQASGSRWSTVQQHFPAAERSGLSRRRNGRRCYFWFV